MATIRYRKLLEGEPQWGQGSSNFIAGVDAVGQAILTRLLLFEGEWWENQLEGLPLWQEILGVGVGNSPQKIAQLIQSRILGTPFVTGINSVQSSYDPNTRAYSYYAAVQTQFGQIVVENIPTPTSRSLPQ
jgi:hypothetical protein